jgi:hypothetical protein
MGSTYQTMSMQRIPREKGWLHYKYGKNVIPWECRLLMPNLDGNACGEFTGDKIQLKYSFEQKLGDNPDFSLKEREPLRHLEIQNPDNYRGQLGLQGMSEQFNADCVYVVNGVIDKCDANFQGSFQF